MNLFSFVDELMKVGAMDPIIHKHASDAPVGLEGSESMPPSDLLRPDEASSRLPKTTSFKSVVDSGNLGKVEQAKNPIDQQRFNRPYEGSR